MNSFFWIVCSLVLGQRKRSWAVHAHWKSFLPLLAWDTSTPNAVKLVLQKVTKELLLHGRHMLISLRLICVHFKLKSVGARDSSDFRHYKSSVFGFPPPEQHSAVCWGQALRYPGQAGVKGDGAQSRFPSQGTLAKGWTGTTNVIVKHPWLHSIKSYINA